MTTLRAPPPSPVDGDPGPGRSGRVLARLADPRLLRWCSLACVVSILALVGSGAWVRLSSSGLGCPTWPNCTAHALVAPDRYHALVEFVNRCVITTVGVLVGAAVLLSLARHPRRTDLRWLAAGLLGGYVGEAVLGGLTVLLKLAPALVATHLVLALLLLSDAIVLHHRSGSRAVVTGPVGREVRWLSDLAVAGVGCGIVIGTVVTGAGPHSGSPGTPRFHFSFVAVAHVHAVTGMFGFGVFVALWVVLRARGLPRWLCRRADAVLVWMALQGALGYATFFTRVQVDVTEVHVIGGALLLAGLVHLRLGISLLAADPWAVPPRSGSATLDGTCPTGDDRVPRPGVPAASGGVGRPAR